MALIISKLVFNDSDLSKYFQYVCMFTVTGSKFPASNKKPEIVTMHSNLVLNNNHLV